MAKAKDDSTSMSVSDFNMEKLTTKQLSEHIASSITFGENIAVFGRRGSGKTEIAKQEIKKSGCHEVYINLSVLERVDLGGFPNVMAAQQQKKFVDYLLPKFYEPMFTEGKGAKDVVALLDEVDKADPSLWAPLLEFTQFKTINGNKLPNLKSVIMTGNLISEGGSRPSLPLLDRAEKYLVSPDASSWLEWAGKEGNIHPAITAYIYDHPQDLFGEVNPDDRYADPSPRGWHRSSNILFKGEEKNASTDLLNAKVSGCVGKSAGLRYANYYEHYRQLLPMVEDIFKGKSVLQEYKALERTKQLVTCMITCSRLANQLDAAKSTEQPASLKHVGKFFQNVDHEMLLITIRSQIQPQRIVTHNLDEHPDWKKFINDINDSINGTNS